MAGQCILAFRTCAIWSFNRPLVYTVAAIITMEAGFLIYGTTTWVGAVVPDSIPGCFPGACGGASEAISGSWELTT
jgi:hypothetical protein